MDAGAAVMILLLCSSAGTDCMEIRSERTFETAQLCRERLTGVVARMNRAGRTVSGRCSIAADERPELDPMVTCSTRHPNQPATATVRVTQMRNGVPITNEWIVPKASDCG